jgi:hypothetical protein
VQLRRGEMSLNLFGMQVRSRRLRRLVLTRTL